MTATVDKIPRADAVLGGELTDREAGVALKMAEALFAELRGNPRLEEKIREQEEAGEAMRLRPAKGNFSVLQIGNLVVAVLDRQELFPNGPKVETR